MVFRGVFMAKYKYLLGPVTSRRLGLSLGVNNIPYKTCTCCIYCQLERTSKYTVSRRSFYNWCEVVVEVVDFIRKHGDEVDYVTIVPDGEPTLDANLGKIIEKVKEVNVKIAVLTNASLLWLENVRKDLELADLVSVKVDAVHESVWKRIYRPHPRLKLEDILHGIEEFSRQYSGILVSETMLVSGVNTDREMYRGVAAFLSRLKLCKAYISEPVRPPAEPFVKPPTEEELVETYEEFTGALGAERVELLNMPEPPPISTLEDPVIWLLNTAAVHPLRYEHALRSLYALVDDSA